MSATTNATATAGGERFTPWTASRGRRQSNFGTYVAFVQEGPTVIARCTADDKVTAEGRAKQVADTHNSHAELYEALAKIEAGCGEFTNFHIRQLCRTALSKVENAR